MLVILTLIPAVSVAVTDEYCAQFSKNQNTCKNAAGCQYYPDIQKCKACQEDYFCAENSDPEACGNEFNLSLTGSTSQNDCYKYIGGTTETNHCEKQDGNHIQTCGLFYPNNAPKCWNPNTGEYDNNYHIETNNNNKCFSNIRNCDLFGKIGCGTGQQIGYTTWNDDSEWVYTTCKCEQGNISYSNCVATVRYEATRINPDSANGTITYGNTVSSYECKKCPAGKYLTQNNFNPNGDTCAGGTKACSCTDTDKGYYSTECTINGTSSCQQTPCPKPGQTTNGLGAGTSVNACHYSHDTKFCDATGCFTIPDAGDDSVWHWTY